MYYVGTFRQTDTTNKKEEEVVLPKNMKGESERCEMDDDIII
jgi:hypothetical protein